MARFIDTICTHPSGLYGIWHNGQLVWKHRKYPKAAITDHIIRVWLHLNSGICGFTGEHHTTCEEAHAYFLANHEAISSTTKGNTSASIRNRKSS